MKLKEFNLRYLQHYLLLEKDFKQTFDYVSVEEDNYGTFSIEFLKQLLSIGSEIDIIKKFIAQLIKPDFDEKKECDYKIILDECTDFKMIEIKFKERDLVLKPWNYDQEPTWWTVYNEVKHNRMEVAEKLDSNKKYYQYANLENTINALAALFSLELFAYRIIANVNKELFVPTIVSVFRIENLFWKDVDHGNGIVMIDSNLYFG